MVHLPLVLEVPGSIPASGEENFGVRWDVNWMSPVQEESPPLQIKDSYGNLDMVTCRLSSCNPEGTKYTCR